jgi:hypothetical protein
MFHPNLAEDTIIRAIGGRAPKAAFNACARLLKNKLPLSVFCLAESFILQRVNFRTPVL